MPPNDRGTAGATDRDGTARAARWLAAQTVVVALLAGVVHRLTMSTLLEGGMSYMGTGGSVLGAVLGRRAVQAFLLAGAVLFACWPVLVLGARRAEGTRLRWFLAAVLVPAAVTAVVLVGASGDRWLLVVPIVVVVAVGVLLSLAVSLLAAIHARSAPDGRLVTLALGVAVLAVCAFAVGAAAAAPLGGLVEVQQYGGVPVASFAFEPTETPDGTLLAITHDGGDRALADRVHVEGNLAPVPDADQPRPGPWNGSTSHAADGRVVEPGDSVTVGLGGSDDCVVRVVYRDGANTASLGQHECGSAGP
jgi:hypothetical protein